MDSVNVPQLLNYGAIGLGCALAYLAYMLLAKEQQQKTVRRPMLQSIYVFMVFSLLLTASGIITEYMRARTNNLMSAKDSQIVSLTKERDEAKAATKTALDANIQLNESRESSQRKLTVLQGQLKTLLGQKVDVVKRLAERLQAVPERDEHLHVLQQFLDSLDKGLAEALDAAN